MSGARFTPYGRGRQWADRQGAYGNLDCGDAIEAYGWDLDSKEAEAFTNGAEARQNEQCEGLDADGCDCRPLPVVRRA